MRKQTFKDYELLINSADSLLDEIKQLEADLEIQDESISKLMNTNARLDDEIHELQEKLKEYEK
jgi:phage shock protein A